MHSIVFGIQWDFFLNSISPPMSCLFATVYILYCSVYEWMFFSVRMDTTYSLCCTALFLYVAERVGTAPTLFRRQKNCSADCVLVFRFTLPHLLWKVLRREKGKCEITCSVLRGRSDLAFCVFVSQCSCDRSRKRWGRDAWWWKLSIITAKAHKSRVCVCLLEAGLLFSCLLQTSLSDYKDAECVLVVWSLCVCLVNYCNWFCWLAGASGQYHVSGHITTDYVLDNTFTKILNLHVCVSSPGHTCFCVCVCVGLQGSLVNQYGWKCPPIISVIMNRERSQWWEIIYS